MDLYIKAEKNHISIFYYILFSFHPDQSFLPGRRQRTLFQQVFIVYDFRFDKPSLKIRTLMVQALVSSSPAVKKLCSPKMR